MTPVAMRLAEATAGDFLPHLATGFTVMSGPDRVAILELREATELAPGEGGRRPPFSLIFFGPTDPALQQGIYALSHAELGDFEIFLVPVGANRESRRYQAIFN